MPVIISGGAGFIGVNLVRHLLSLNIKVIVFDNLSNSSISQIEEFICDTNFIFVNVDISNLHAYDLAVKNLGIEVSAIWHLAANSDIQSGISDPDIDLRDTFMTTFNTLKIVRKYSIRTLSFASSSAIYGDQGNNLITEDMGPLLPISNYGAMKLASEAIICSATESFLERAYIYRFPNVVGAPATHGVILDLIRKLKKTPNHLLVLGSGAQEKPYLHVDDLIDAMFFVQNSQSKKLNIFNIAPNNLPIKVSRIAEEIVQKLSPFAKIEYGKMDKGWLGDIPRVNYSSDKIYSLGWTPRLNSSEAISLAIDEILKQEL
jgi:UDP-glucose 4-epimerase